MKSEKRIYCIEGHWNYGAKEAEPSVEPILQMLQGLDQWQYARRDCATEDELRYWIDHEWMRCKEGSVLYFAAHGTSGQIWLSDDVSMDMATIGSWDCTNCWVHFGGCNVLEVADETIKEFMTHSGATVVSGYAVETGWADTMYAPALALEMMLFSSIKDVKLDDGRSRRRLKSIADSLSGRFKDCGFRLHTKESVEL